MKKLSEKSLPGLHVILLLIGCGIIWFCNLSPKIEAGSFISFTIMILGIHFLLGANGLAYVYGIFKKSVWWKIYSGFFGVMWAVAYLLHLSGLIW